MYSIVLHSHVSFHGSLTNILLLPTGNHLIRKNPFRRFCTASVTCLAHMHTVCTVAGHSFLHTMWYAVDCSAFPPLTLLASLKASFSAISLPLAPCLTICGDCWVTSSLAVEKLLPTLCYLLHTVLSTNHFARIIYHTPAACFQRNRAKPY